MTPYYDENGITIYHGDGVALGPELVFGPDRVLLTDPPYGIAYKSNRPRLYGNARSIANDADAGMRDLILDWWYGPAVVFGSWRKQKPARTRATLIWDKGGALGMGDLSIPWKVDHEEVYIIGKGFVGRRDCGSVLRFAPEQSMGRLHPHQKPIPLLISLLLKCPAGEVFDPFMGSGSTLVAAKALGRRAIGIELEERYCEIAARRLSQGVLDFRAPAAPTARQEPLL